jgi:hypothetical protein
VDLIMFFTLPNNIRYILIGALIIVTSILFEGCATFQPQTITCESLGTVRIYNEDSRNGDKLFSVLPPSKTSWCLKGTGDPNVIVYITSKFMGQYLENAPPREDTSHTFGIMANTVRVDTVDISSSSSMKNFMERWFFEGLQSYSRVNGERQAEFTPLEGTERFASIRMDIEFDNSFGANCVRFESLQEETDNPRYRNWIFDLKNNGVACQHPSTPNLVVMVTFSERHKKGLENPQLTNRIRTEAERTIKSLEFGEMQ